MSEDGVELDDVDAMPAGTLRIRGERDGGFEVSFDELPLNVEAIEIDPLSLKRLAESQTTRTARAL